MRGAYINIYITTLTQLIVRIHLGFRIGVITYQTEKYLVKIQYKVYFISILKACWPFLFDRKKAQCFDFRKGELRFRSRIFHFLRLVFNKTRPTVQQCQALR